ncbi:hypothetical protein KM043_002778 [Ampulex compressa]|nr:hypothetical protein KM043_002778 [Ampulex compressa]
MEPRCTEAAVANPKLRLPGQRGRRRRSGGREEGFPRSFGRAGPRARDMTAGEGGTLGGGDAAAGGGAGPAKGGAQDSSAIGRRPRTTTRGGYHAGP